MNITNMETNNMNIRERFEEIWPVPDVIMWSEYIGRYIPMPDEVLQYERLNEQWAHEHNARLDTFARCQETTAIYLSLIEELVADVRYRAYHDADDDDDEKSKALLHRINQIMERKK